MKNLNMNVQTTRDEMEADIGAAVRSFDGPVDQGALKQAVVGVLAAFPPGDKGDAVTVALAVSDGGPSVTASVSVTVAKPIPTPPKG